MDRFEADLMDELMSDAAEGPAARHGHAYDEFDEFDEGDEFDGADAGDDEFLGQLLGGIGRVASGLLGGGGNGGDGFDEGDEFDGFDEGDEFDGFDAAGDDGGDDAFEAAVADAMDAGDGDEFFRRLGRIARSVGRGIGSVARVVGPIASMIPLPQAQLIGRLANVAGRLMADGADEFEAFDEFVDGLDEDGIDAAAPVLAGMVIRRALPSVARAAAPVRRAAVRAVSQAVRSAVRRQGPQAARAVARAVTATRRIVQRRNLPARQAVQAVRNVTRQVAARPQAVQRLSRPLVAPARRATPRGQVAQVVARQVAPIARQVAVASGRPVAAGRGGHVCVNCRRHRRLLARGPVVINLRCR
ncbi:MAG: hypothetical protein EKK52_15565 [Burkholderiales bacterium]|uniref:hypothetical protein n=2 Tax=Pseudomonadota TaxID=1224 RepID=UPI000FAB5CBA|nr:MAG: hypothetical protein EKK52_15565 [Burkholderiales bacterium]